MRVKRSVKLHVSYRDVCEIYLTKRALNWLITEQGDLANINMFETVIMFSIDLIMGRRRCFDLVKMKTKYDVVSKHER